VVYTTKYLGKIEGWKATFPEELPLCCADLISAAIYTRLHRVFCLT